ALMNSMHRRALAVAVGIVDPDNSFWQSPSLPLDTVQNRRLRHQFSLNTCNGCHGRETGSTGRAD
ncbi:MAG TPA: hypothetical protein VEU33_29600, partial [Archangium sp.]|nr:hypothetical protein [Archangium sp.]